MTEPFTRESMLASYAANGGDVDPKLIHPDVCVSCSDGGKVPTSRNQDTSADTVQNHGRYDTKKVSLDHAPDTREIKREVLKGYGCECVDDDPGDCGCRCEEPVDPHGVRLASPPLGARGILEEAGELVYVDREATYGDPSETLTRVGRIWGALLDREPLSADEVAVMMAGLKLARQMHTPKRDNLRDGAGYLELADRVLRREKV